MIALDAADVFVAGKYVKYLYLETVSLKSKNRIRSHLDLKSRNMGIIQYNESFPLQVLWVGANCSRRLFRLRSQNLLCCGCSQKNRFPFNCLQLEK